MSAFFVSYGTVDDAVEAFREIARGPLDPDALGRALLAMNAEAMRQRYPQILTERLDCGRIEHDVYLAAARAYRWCPGHPDGRQRAKSAACLAYQCHEGDVPGTPLYRRLDAVAAQMAERHPWQQDGPVFRSDGLAWDRDRASGPAEAAAP